MSDVTPDPIAPDGLREDVHTALRSGLRLYLLPANVAAYHVDTITHDLVASIGADVLTDAVLAEVAKHRDAEVERLREIVDEFDLETEGKPTRLTVAQDRITRALEVLNGPWTDSPAVRQARAILTDPSTTDARPDGESK